MKRFSFWLTLLLAISLSCASLAETLVLPADMTQIEANAFENCTSITGVICPDGLQTICENAFAGCTQLASITIPGSVSEIGENAFSGSAFPLLIRTSAGSAAMQYAIDNDLDYQADTTYRALLIGQCNYQSAAVLNGTLNDVQSMQTVLSSFADTPYAVSTRTDLTASQITQEISSAFAQAQPQDVSLVFYAGHGMQGGSLYGIDSSTLTPAALRECLDAIPGRKILIVDACYSGALIGRSASEADAQEFTSAFLSAFATTARSTTLAADEYYVLTAAHSTQNSAEIANGSKSYGVFTTMLAKGCGYNYLTSSACSLYADTDGDSVITLQEAYKYAMTQALVINSKQNAQVWPESCTYLGLFRK